MKYLKIFTNFLDVTAALSDGAMGRLFRAMLLYAENGTETAFRGKEAVAWAVAKQQIDRERETYESKVNSVEKARNYRTKQRSDRNEMEPREEKEKEKENEKEKEKEKERERIGAAPLVSAAASRALSVPTLEEVEAYCRERGNQVDPQYFYDYYAANGWRVGKNPMRDWRAAVRAWEGNGMGNRQTPAREKMSEREVFQKAIELHRRKEAAPIPFP